MNIFDNIFVECFGSLEDKRYKNKQHSLLDIIVLCLCGILSGMKDFVAINEFAVAHEEWFKKYLILNAGIPGDDTLSRVISSLAPKKITSGAVEFGATLILNIK